MRKAIVLALVGILGCGDSGIEPEPGATSSSGNSMGANASAGGSDGAGANGQGGSGQGGAGNTAALGYENGSRLKARNFVAADGAKQFKAFYDTELDVECFFGDTDDGVRCLPNGAQIPNNYFSDSGCTARTVLETNGACAAPKYANEILPVCGYSRRIYAVGAAVGQVYQLAGGNCTSATLPTGWDLYELGAEVPNSSFVSATVD